MDIKYQKFITGTFTERLDGEFTIKGTVTIDYQLPDGSDIRDKSEVEGRALEEKARKDLYNSFKERLLLTALKELQEEAQKGKVVTELIPGKLVIINPRTEKEENEFEEKRQAERGNSKATTPSVPPERT